MKFYTYITKASLIILVLSSPIAIGEVMEKKSVIDLLRGIRSVPIEQTAIENLFDAKIEITKGNGFWQFYEGDGGTLRDGTIISKFGFMKNNTDTYPPSVYMNLSGACVKFSEIEKEYPDIVLNGPRISPHSPHVAYVYADQVGEMRFAFKVDKHHDPECLVNVGFSPKEKN